MAAPKASGAFRWVFKMVDATDFATPETGQTVTVQASKNGAAFAGLTGSPAVTEIANGWYYVDVPSGDATNPLVLKATATGCAQTDEVFYLDSKLVSELNDVSTAQVNTECDAAISDASLATAAALATVDGVVDAILVDTDTTLPATLSTIAGYIDTEVAAIKAKTDALPASPAATGDIPTAAAVADAVWDETLSGHLGAGSTGEALNAAGAAGDPWTTSLPGAYGAGSAGYIVGNNLDAPVGTVDTVVDAIKAKTDNLPAAPAAVGDIPTANENADALLKRDWTAVTGEAARSVLNALRFLRNKWSVSGTTLTVTKEDDATSAWTGTVTADATADPITGNDPT